MKTYPGAILGFRLWFSSPPILASTGIGAGIWERGINYANCRTDKHNAPDRDCACGIYALHSLKEARAHRRSFILELGEDIPGGGGVEIEARELARLDQNSLPNFAPHLVLGAVAGAGRAEIHWNGWRAEEAQIIGLLSPKNADYSEISSHYKVGVWDDPREFEKEMKKIAGEITPDLPPPLDQKILDNFKNTYHRDPLAARNLVGGGSLANDLSLHFGLNPDAK